jgi:hypothetical protein
MKTTIRKSKPKQADTEPISQKELDEALKQLLKPVKK